MAKHIRGFNESSLEDKYILVVYQESGDEIHFNVINYSYYDDIYQYIDNDIQGGSDYMTSVGKDEKVSKLIKLIRDNSVFHLMCQTYVPMDYSQISKYNILKCINLPELGH